MPTVSLSSRPIVITGASSGIGHATALRCAMEGMPILLMARRHGRLEEVEKQIRESGGKAVSFVGDVNDPEHCRCAVERCADAFGAVYSVFANAGFGFEEPVHEMSDVRLRSIFETNFFGTMNVIRPAIPLMLNQRAGHVLICSSCVARFPLPYYSAYSATKAAQHHIGRALNLELKPFGVFTSTVHPIGTKTEFFDTARVHSGGDSALMTKHSHDLFMQRPDKVARAVVRCLRRPRPEVWTSVFVRYGMCMAGAMPRIADAAVKKMVDDRLRRHELAQPQGKVVEPSRDLAADALPASELG